MYTALLYVHLASALTTFVAIATGLAMHSRATNRLSSFKEHLLSIVVTCVGLVTLSGTVLALLSPEVSARGLCDEFALYLVVVVPALFIFSRGRPIGQYPTVFTAATMCAFLFTLAIGQ